MSQTSKPKASGLLAKWLTGPERLFAPLQPNQTSAEKSAPGLRGKVQAVMNYEPLRNRILCDLAKNVWTGVSQVSRTSLDTPTEKSMMSRYFGGGGGKYHLSPSEWNAAVQYYNTYGKNVLSGPSFRTENGGKRQNINFTGSYGDERLDGLLGTATGYFDRDRNLTGLRDSFDFDDNSRANSTNPFGQGWYAFQGKAVGLAQNDADIFCPRRSNPVSITGGARR